MLWFRAPFDVSLGGGRPLRHEDACVLWARLRRAFPWTVSAALGPGEVQLLAHVGSRTDALGRLDAALQASGVTPLPSIATQRVRADRWAAVDASVLGLPARRGWVVHPLAWGWSTARDVAGAAIDPWVAPAHHRRSVRALRPLWPLSEVAGSVQAGVLRRGPLSDRIAHRAAAAVMRLPPRLAKADERVRGLASALTRGAGKDPHSVPEAWVRAALRAASHPELCRFVGPPSRGGATASSNLQPPVGGRYPEQKQRVRSGARSGPRRSGPM